MSELDGNLERLRRSGDNGEGINTAAVLPKLLCWMHCVGI